MAVYAVVRTYRHLRDFGRIVRSVEDGLVPILREVSGFRYHAIRCGESAGVSVTLFASDGAAQAGPHGAGASGRACGDHPPETVTGEVIVAAEP